MIVSYQPSMLDPADGDARLSGLEALTRHPLSDGAWVDHLPGWVCGSDVVLEALLVDVPWHAERRRMYDTDVDVPRLLAWFGAGSPLPHPILTQAFAALNRHYEAELGEHFATAGLCLYRDGRDSVAWHGDTLGRSRHQDTMVAILSFGSPRPLLLRPRAHDAGSRPELAMDQARPASPRRFMLGHGDLVVMGGSCQRTWQHCVPKTTRPTGPRVSVQFRPIGVA